MNTPTLGSMQPRLTRWRVPMSRFAVGAAWFFIGFSLLHLVWAISMLTSQGMGLVTLYQTDAAGETYRALALAYGGWFGLLLAVTELTVVLAAAIWSARSNLRLRRIAHGVLIGWSALWMLNLMRLFVIDGRFDSFVQTAILTFLFGCTIHRAARGWSGRPRDGAALTDHLPEEPPAACEEPAEPENDLSANWTARDDAEQEITSISPDSLRWNQRAARRVHQTTPRIARVIARAWQHACAAFLSLIRWSRPVVASSLRVLRRGAGTLLSYLRSHGVLPGPSRSAAS